jgi:hypothetical protein
MASFEADGPWHLMTMLSPDIIFFQLCMGNVWYPHVSTKDFLYFGALRFKLLQNPSWLFIFQYF